jgi:hypothetical protein
VDEGLEAVSSGVEHYREAERLLASLTHDDGTVDFRLVNDPEDVVVAVVRLNTKSLMTDVATGYIVPTARILSIEPMLDESAQETAIDLMRLAYEARTGLSQLPFEVEEQRIQTEADQLLGTAASSDMLRHGSGLLLGKPADEQDDAE